MKTLVCARCGTGVFFENVSCTQCGAVLGFDPDVLAFASFEIGADGGWTRVGTPGPALKPCTNYAVEKVCNWMLPADAPHSFCRCCRTTDVIPALSIPANRHYWLMLEQAKRRLFYSLISLDLPAPSKADDPANGLSFQFLEELTPREKVLTGHDEGTITLNIAEADDAKREGLRAHLHEQYRTLVGHFRHEIGHYYWDRLIDGGPWIDEYRQLFGDERADYSQALKKHYADPRTDWADHFISVYASSHPWEDWAECWAHYMHAQDGLETAHAWGLHLQRQLANASPVDPMPINAATPSIHRSMIEQWLPVSQFINAMDRSLGSHDSYPFVLIEPVVEKLEFIHKVVSSAVTGRSPMKFAVQSLLPVHPIEPVTADTLVAPVAPVAADSPIEPLAPIAPIAPMAPAAPGPAAAPLAAAPVSPIDAPIAPPLASPLAPQTPPNGS